MVIMPDYFRGGWQDPTDQSESVKFIQRETKWDGLKVDFNAKILPFAREQGAKIFGILGEPS